MENYMKEVNQLRELISSVTSTETPDITKTESIDPALSEIGCRRFNYPWCTGHSPKIYFQGSDLIIQKDPDDF